MNCYGNIYEIKKLSTILINIIIFGVVAYLTYMIIIQPKLAQRKLAKIPNELDSPVDFGYKTNWFAIKSTAKNDVVENLDLKKYEELNWQNGIDQCSESGIFITPTIGNWTLLVGRGLPSADSIKGVEEVEIILKKLSKEFEEAQFFGTHRVVEYQTWGKAKNGIVERMYSYIGDSGENIVAKGEASKIEGGKNLFNSFSKEVDDENYFEDENLIFPNEEMVMTIAENWSVNPTKLSERDDIKKKLGFYFSENI